MIAHDAVMRSRHENAHVGNIDKARQRVILSEQYRKSIDAKAHEANIKRKAAPTKVENKFPTTGKIRGVIILAEFQDNTFSHHGIHDIYESMANDEGYSGPYAHGSIRDYFVSQSGGMFEPTFDVVGPVKLPHEMAYYGYDEKAAMMMMDACTLADKEHGVDFSRYDYNSDGYIDFVFVVYAGYSQAQGAGEETVWPQAVDLTYESWDTYDGLYLSQAACSSELRGKEGTDIDGIGTFCHEFSHIIGLPDIYDPMYSGMKGMMSWDVMDVGLYNDNGRTPSGYTAMDKYTAGWLEPTVIDGPATGLRLNPLSESNEAYFIVCSADNSEFFTLENRQQSGWDSGLGGHGLIISQIHYVPALWASNRVNTKSSAYEHVALVPADGQASKGSEHGDPFPGSTNNTEFTDTSMPAATWHTTTAPAESPITNITEKDGVVTFDYKAITNSISTTYRDSHANIRIRNQEIYIDNPNGETITVADANGRQMYTTSRNHVSIRPGKGIFIVTCGQTKQKVIL